MQSVPVGVDQNGFSLVCAGRIEDAIITFQREAELRPDLASAHLNLGSALRLAGRHSEAVEAFQAALYLQPGWHLALFNLGHALLETGDLTGAFDALRQTVELVPEWGLAHNAMGLTLMNRMEPDRAKLYFQKALALAPDLHAARHSLARAHWLSGEIDPAISLYRQGVREGYPLCPECHMGLSLCLLACGDYRNGWCEYEWRWPFSGHTPYPKRLGCPVWDGAPLDGKSIILWAEQGLGDILQFIRFAGHVRDRGGRVCVFSRPSLDRLLAACPGVDRVISDLAEIGEFDFQLPLASLPRVLETTLENLPAEVPYLAPPVPCARDPFGPRRGGAIRVGIVWGVEPGHPNWQGRSCPLPLFRMLERVSGVELYSLQFGALAAELRRPDAPRAADLSAVLGDLGRTAALVDHLDLVVTVDTSMAHLAGALGRPVWTLVPYDADWRWLRGREDSPWYPTMRLFRQQERGRWEPVLERVASALGKMRPEAPRGGEVA